MTRRAKKNAGQIITFYSYKGGSGCTMAVANVAWILASNGKRVLVIDWDLESPGLHRFFHPFLDVAKLAATPGLIEIISDYAWATLRPEGGEVVGDEIDRRDSSDSNWYRQYAHVMRHAISIDWDHFKKGGVLDFLSPGKQNRDYSSMISTFDWDNFYERLGGGQFFEAMREDMKKQYDYILIDSRSGLSDVVDICTIQFPDVLIDCFTLNTQSIDGAASIARQISKRYHGRNIRVLPVPMRIDDGEREKLTVGRALARRRFAGFPNGFEPREIEDYWQTVEIPYKRFYAFEEILATFGDEIAIPTSLLASFERLTSAITNRAVNAMPRIDNEIRTRYLNMFTRREIVAQPKAVVSYAPEDRMWADWIAALLERVGIEISLRSVRSATELEDTTIEPNVPTDEPIISILTPAYLGSLESQRLFELTGALRISDTHQQVIGVRVSEIRSQPSFPDIPIISLSGLDEAVAAERLVAAVGQVTGISGGLKNPEVRFPGTKPKVWNLPRRNPAFTGRGDLLERLRDELVGRGQAVVVPQALFGLGGVGKTQAVLEYAHRFAADYDLIWWVPSKDSGQINQSLAELARHLDIRTGLSISETVRSVLEVLRLGHQFSRWLLIFDNAENPQEVEKYLPGAVGHVLITSLNQEWSNLAEAIQVDVFSRKESIERLIAEVPRLKRIDADRVAAALGDLPLAVEQAAAWLRQTAMMPATYIERLESEGQAQQILAANQVPSYPVPVVSTWNVSFERLNDRSPAAGRLLQLLAFCSSDSISMHLLYNDAVIRCLNKYDSAMRDVIMLGTVIQDLGRFAMVTIDQGRYTIRIHRLVQAVIRSKMNNSEQVDACRDVHSMLVDARPTHSEAYGDSDDPENWARFNIIWPHLEPSHAAEHGDEDVRNLLIEWVRFLWKRNDFDTSLSVGRTLDKLWRESLGEMDRQILYLRFHLANVRRSQGHYDEAYELDMEVLNKQRDVLGPEHPAPLMTAGSLAADLRALGRYREALERDLVTHEKLEDLLGADHRRTLAAANNLAVSYRLVGDYFSARELDSTTLQLRTSVLGELNPYTLCSAANLGRDLREAGEYIESIFLLRTTYNNFTEILGEDELDTLRTATSLATSLRKAGEDAQARSLDQYALDRYVRRYSDSSPDALSCKLNLACDYAAAGDAKQAYELSLEVRDIYEASQGSDHPYTLVAANNLSIYLRRIGRLRDGQSLAEATLRAMQTELGEDHPSALSCALNVANGMAQLDRMVDAEDLARETMEKLHEKRGPQHPETILCEGNLAILLHDRGRNAEASQLIAQVLHSLRSLLSDQHHNVVALTRWQRVDSELETQPV